MQNKNRFLDLLRSVSRDGIEDLINWIEQTDFYVCPASTRFHNSYAGGLLQHSLNVYDEFQRLLTVYGDDIKIERDSVIIMALLHDLCKANFYATEKRNRKNAEGRWESYDAFTVNELYPYGSHGGKSVAIISNFIKLTWIEAAAINCHMGGWSEDPQGVGRVYEKYPAAWLLSVADQSATYVAETKQHN